MRFETRQWVPYPVEFVFAFFADPRNLPRLMSEALGTRIEELRLMPPQTEAVGTQLLADRVASGKGSEIWISFRPAPFLPVRLHWLARITEFDWNNHFKDEQVRGPFSTFRHRHGTLPETRDGQAGTLVTDEIDYALPFGPLDRLVIPLVQRQLRRSFAQRQKRLPQMLADLGKN